MALQRGEGVCVHFHHSPPESRQPRFGAGLPFGLLKGQNENNLAYFEAVCKKKSG